MNFITIDLIDDFKMSPKGYQYVLTVIDMLMNYTWCILSYTKKDDEVVHTYLGNVYSKFGRSQNILWDNVTELKNKLFAQVAATLGIKEVLSSPYYPWGNQWIDNEHNIFKTSM